MAAGHAGGEEPITAAREAASWNAAAPKHRRFGDTTQLIDEAGIESRGDQAAFAPAEQVTKIRDAARMAGYLGQNLARRRGCSEPRDSTPTCAGPLIEQDLNALRAMAP